MAAICFGSCRSMQSAWDVESGAELVLPKCDDDCQNFSE